MTFSKFPFFRLQVVGHSMAPTLKPGQVIISFNWYPFKKLRVGDLIVIKLNGKLMVKRGQKIDGRHIFVQGDNPKFSTDSRQFGWIEREQIVGKVVFKL